MTWLWIAVLGCAPAPEYHYKEGIQAAEYVGCQEGHELGVEAADAAVEHGDDLGDPWSWVPPEDLQGVQACIERSGAEAANRDIADDCALNARLGAIECYAPAYIGQFLAQSCP